MFLKGPYLPLVSLISQRLICETVLGSGYFSEFGDDYTPCIAGKVENGCFHDDSFLVLDNIVELYGNKLLLNHSKSTEVVVWLRRPKISHYAAQYVSFEQAKQMESLGVKLHDRLSFILQIEKL